MTYDFVLNKITNTLISCKDKYQLLVAIKYLDTLINKIKKKSDRDELYKYFLVLKQTRLEDFMK